MHSFGLRPARSAQRAGFLQSCRPIGHAVGQRYPAWHAMRHCRRRAWSRSAAHAALLPGLGIVYANRSNWKSFRQQSLCLSRNDPLNLINPFGLCPYSPSGRVASTLVDMIEVILADALPGVGVATVAVAGGILTAITASTTSPQQDESQHTFFHGTTVPSALALLNGAPINVSAIQQMTLNKGGDPAFYLATDSNSAACFGSLHITSGTGSTVIQYTMDLSAVQTLVGESATLGPIRQLGAPGNLRGQQFVVPSIAFSTFNTLIKNGQIVVSPFRGS